MPGRPKKHRRREADEVGAGSRMSKKGIAMTCSRCLKIGHNKATCKASETEVAENHRKAAEAKKTQSEAAKAHSLRNKQNVRKQKKAQPEPIADNTSLGQGQSKKRGRPLQKNHDDPQAPSTQEVTIETAQKIRRGRPPKASNTQPQTKKRPAGVGVLIGDDGHTYLSTSTSTVRVTGSQPCTPTQTPKDVQGQSSSSQTCFSKE